MIHVPIGEPGASGSGVGRSDDAGPARRRRRAEPSAAQVDARKSEGTSISRRSAATIDVSRSRRPRHRSTPSAATSMPYRHRRIEDRDGIGRRRHTFEQTRLKELTLHSVSGDLDVSSDLADGAQVQGSTTSGFIRLAVNRDVGAVVDLRTTTSSGIKNLLSDDKPTREMSGGGTLDVTLGNGSGVIELTSISGRLELLAR